MGSGVAFYCLGESLSFNGIFSIEGYSFPDWLYVEVFLLFFVFCPEEHFCFSESIFSNSNKRWRKAFF